MADPLGALLDAADDAVHLVLDEFELLVVGGSGIRRLYQAPQMGPKHLEIPRVAADERRGVVEPEEYLHTKFFLTEGGVCVD